MRSPALLVLLALAACGEAPDGTTITARPAPSVSEPAPDRAPRAVPPPEADAVAARVESLLAEIRESPKTWGSTDVIDAFVALGPRGLEALMSKRAASDDEKFRQLIRDVAERLGPDAIEVIAKALIAADRPMRDAGLTAVGGLPERTWPYFENAHVLAAALLAALTDEDVSIRRWALHALGAVGPTGVPVTEAIAARLVSADADERERANDALQRLGPDATAAVPALLALLLHSDDETRLRAKDTLSSLGGGSPENVRQIVALLEDPNPRVRSAAAGAVIAWREAAPALVPALLRLLDDADEDVVDAAAASLDNLAEAPEVAAALRDALPSLSAAAAIRVLDYMPHDTTGLAPVVRALLTSPDADLRATAASWLSPRDGEPFDPLPLRPLLEDSDHSVRVSAASALVDRDPPSRERVLAIARTAATASDASTRTRAAEILAAACDPAAPSGEVIRLLADGSEDVRSVVERRLASSSNSLGPAPAGVLDGVIGDALDPYGSNSAAAVATAIRFDAGVAALVSAAVKALDAEDPIARRALEVLEKLGPMASDAVEAVGKLDRIILRPARERALLAISGDPSWLTAGALDGTAASARRVLGYGDPGAAILVQAAAFWTQWTADAIVKDVAPNVALARAVESASAAEGDDDAASDMRRGAVRLAAVLGHDRGVALCVRLAAFDNDRTRSAVAESLASLGDAGADLAAADVLRTLLNDEDGDLRQAAIPAARRLPKLAADVRRRLADEEPSVRFQAAAAILDTDADDAEARRVFFAALLRGSSSDQLAYTDWDLAGGVLERLALTADDAPALAAALLSVDECGTQKRLLAALPRLGAGAAPCVTGVRMALAGDLSCSQGMHGGIPSLAEAIAAAAAMGPAAAAAVPELRRIAHGEPEFADAVRAAIARIEGTKSR